MFKFLWHQLTPTHAPASKSLRKRSGENGAGRGFDLGRFYSYRGWQYPTNNLGIMIPKRFSREVSRSAWAAIRISGFSLTLFVVAGLLHRFGFLETGQFLATLLVVAISALLALLLAAKGFHSLWKYGSIAGKRSVLAVLISSMVLSPFGYALYKTLTLPRLADISTDLADPPVFSRIRDSGLNASVQKSAYPNVSGRRYEITADRVVPFVEKLIADFGWVPVTRNNETVPTEEILIEADVKTFIFGFKDSIVVRITDEGQTTFVDMRSRSGFGDNDLGANAARITDFLKELDLLVATAPAVQPGK
jgi:uncharacterized protein (DUF1499 family)